MFTTLGKNEGRINEPQMVMEVWLSSDSTFVIFRFRVIFRLTSRSFFCIFFCGSKIEPACFVSFFRCSYGQIFRFFCTHHNHKDVIVFFFNCCILPIFFGGKRRKIRWMPQQSERFMDGELLLERFTFRLASATFGWSRTDWKAAGMASIRRGDFGRSRFKGRMSLERLKQGNTKLYGTCLRRDTRNLKQT